MVRFPFEETIKNNLPMPDDLCLLDQYAFQMLARIYANFRSGIYDKGTAGREKDKLWKEWNEERGKAAFTDKLLRHHVLITRKTERLRAEILKSQSVERRAELAVELVEVLDGMVFDDGKT